MAHRKFVSTDDIGETFYWTKAFEASPSELRRAVGKVGPSVAAIRRYLNENEPD